MVLYGVFVLFSSFVFFHSTVLKYPAVLNVSLSHHSHPDFM